MSEPQIDEAEAIERLTVTITEAPDDQTLTFSLGHKPHCNLTTNL